MRNRKGAFDRSEYIGFRCPNEDKRKIAVLATKAKRDVSSLMIEWMLDGAAKLERDLGRRDRERLAPELKGLP